MTLLLCCKERQHWRARLAAGLLSHGRGTGRVAAARLCAHHTDGKESKRLGNDSVPRTAGHMIKWPRQGPSRRGCAHGKASRAPMRCLVSNAAAPVCALLACMHLCRRAQQGCDHTGKCVLKQGPRHACSHRPDRHHACLPLPFSGRGADATYTHGIWQQGMPPSQRGDAERESRLATNQTTAGAHSLRDC
jgi:hypothetical protein